MQDNAKLDHLLECLHELSWVDDHLPHTVGGLHDRLNVIREDLRQEILKTVHIPPDGPFDA